LNRVDFSAPSEKVTRDLQRTNTSIIHNGGSRKSINPYRTGIPKLGVATAFRKAHKLTTKYRKLYCVKIGTGTTTT